MIQVITVAVISFAMRASGTQVTWLRLISMGSSFQVLGAGLEGPLPPWL